MMGMGWLGRGGRGLVVIEGRAIGKGASDRGTDRGGEAALTIVKVAWDGGCRPNIFMNKYYSYLILSLSLFSRFS